MPASRVPDPADGTLITDAHFATSREMAGRVRRYVITMSFRTACFLALVFVPGVAPKVVLFVAALVLPYIAVIFANQADTRRSATGFRAASRDARALPDASTPVQAPDVISGTVVDYPSPDWAPHEAAARNRDRR